MCTRRGSQEVQDNGLLNRRRVHSSSASSNLAPSASFAPVAQWIRASHSGCEGRRFESSRAYSHAHALTLILRFRSRAQRLKEFHELNRPNRLGNSIEQEPMLQPAVLRYSDLEVSDCKTCPLRMIPPPRSSSPSYRAAIWPGLMARCGVSKETEKRSSEIRWNVPGTSGER